MNNPDALLTPAQVAERLTISRSMVYQLKDAGEIPHVLIGSRVRFQPADVERYITDNRREPKLRLARRSA